MGLGKTLQMIAVIVHDLVKSGSLKSQDGGSAQPRRRRRRRRHPMREQDPRWRRSSLLQPPSFLLGSHSWRNSPCAFICAYHGPNRNPDPTLLARFDVVVTLWNREE